MSDVWGARLASFRGGKMWVRNVFVVSPQIANPQISGLIPQSQIRTFLRFASPQIANPQIFND
jgi:hypothetical protein